MDQRRRGQLCGLLAAAAWSLAGLLQRALPVGVATLTAGRALFAALTLLLFLAITRRESPFAALARLGRPGVEVASCIAVASSLFMVSLHYTTVAQVLLLQAVSPVIAAVFAWMFLGERVRGRTWLAMIVALAGVAVMVGGATHRSVRGDALALVSATAFALSVVLIRKHREVSMVPATALSQVIVFAVLAPFASFNEIDGKGVTLIAIFGIVQMAGGLALFTVAARLIPVAELTLLVLLEVVLGPLWVWIAVRRATERRNSGGRLRGHRRRGSANDRCRATRAGIASRTLPAMGTFRPGQRQSERGSYAYPSPCASSYPLINATIARFSGTSMPLSSAARTTAPLMTSISVRRSPSTSCSIDALPLPAPMSVA